MLRVALLSLHTHPFARPGTPKAGGLNITLREIAPRLSAQGVEVDLFVPGPEEERTLRPGLRLIGTGPCPLRVLRHHVARRNYDLIHAHYWVSGIYGLKLREEFHLPLVISFHTLERGKSLSCACHTPDLEREAAEEHLAHQADFLVAASTCEKRQLVELYGVAETRIEVVHPGVDLRRFRPLRPPPSPPPYRLLYVGRLVPEKGLEFLLQALREADFPYRLQVVGGSPEEVSAFREKARRWGIPARFAGALPHRQLPEVYSKAHVLVVPSFYESFGLVALEASACGRPVVASEVGGLPLIVEPGVTGALFPPGDAEVLLQALRSVLERGLGHFRRAARAKATAFTWRASALRLIQVYRYVLGHARGVEEILEVCR